MLTHSDASLDSRILKASELATSAGNEVLVLGLRDATNGETLQMPGILVHSLVTRMVQKWLQADPRVKQGRLLNLRRAISHLIMYLETCLVFMRRGLLFRPHLIHCNDWFVLPIAVIIKLVTGSKLLYDAHELESSVNGVSASQEKFIQKVEHACWKQVDFFVTVSPSIESWYLRRFGPKPSSVVMNSPKLEAQVKPLTTNSYLRDVFGIGRDQRIFIYIGMISRGRGIEMIADVFSRTDSKSVAVFLGSGDLEDYLRNDTGFGSKLFIHAPVPHSEVVSVAQSADFGLCLIENASLSDFFCLPNKLFEYAFAGLQVIASDFPDLSYVVEKFNLGICIEPTPASLSLALNQVTIRHKNNPAELQALSWQAQGQVLLSSYRQALFPED